MPSHSVSFSSPFLLIFRQAQNNKKHQENLGFCFLLCKYDSRPRILFKVLTVFVGGGGLPQAGNSAGLQSIIRLLASYTVTLSKLTNGKFLHTPLNRGALLHSLITARTLNATFVPLYSQRGFSFITSTPHPPPSPHYQGRRIKAQLMRI